MLKLSSLHISFYRILLFSLTTVNSIHPLIIYHQVHFSLFLYSTIFSHNYCTNILQLYILKSYQFSIPTPAPHSVSILGGCLFYIQPCPFFHIFYPVLSNFHISSCLSNFHILIHFILSFL